MTTLPPDSALPPAINSLAQTSTPGSILPPIQSSDLNSLASLGMGLPASQRVKEEDLDRAKIFPLIVGAVALLAGIILWLAFDDSFALSAVAYLCSPFVIVFALGLDNYLQQRGIVTNAWFAPQSNYGRGLKAMAALGIIFSWPHITVLANHISAWLATIFPGLAS